MSCYHPLKAFPVGVHVSGKTKYKICSYDTHHVTQYTSDGGWHPISEPFYGSTGVHRTEYVEIPCGKCIGCRLDYSRQWANRCMMEVQYHENSLFLTLTYDDDHVPKSYYPDPETGEAQEVLTLCKRDFQLFMKRLRKNSGQDLRYFACGEYGSTTFRPHYHAIVFGLKLDDLEVYQHKRNYVYYTSPFLSSCWSNGFAIVGEVNWDTCAYTARYIMKKADGIEKAFFDDFGLQNEFTLMSRKPGIARQFYEEHKDIYDYDLINISTPKGGKQFRPPRYYDKIFDIENPEEMSKIKQKRKDMAKAIEKLKLAHTQLTKQEMLEVEERNKRSQIKSLERNII